MGKSKKKSQSTKNAGTETGKGQKTRQNESSVLENTKLPQVESKSGVWDVEDRLNNSSDKDASDSSMMQEGSSQNESYSVETSFSEPRKSGKISPILYNKNTGNSREDTNPSYNRNFRSNNDSYYNTRKSEPYRGGYKDRDDDKRDRNNRHSLNNTASNKRTWEDSSYKFARSAKRCRRTLDEDKKQGKTNSNRILPRKGRNYTKNKSRDPEFDAYRNECNSNWGRTRIQYTKVKEIVKNLFDMDKDYSLAHCVAEDMNMGSGIAVQFRRDFKRVHELLNQRQVKGGLAILQDETRYIYYLVTKTFSYGKPTYETLFSSLKKLKEHVIEHKVEKLAMPRIGCGLDRLEWSDVKFMLEFLFRDLDVEIIICNLEPTEESSQQRHRNCKVTHEKYPIEEIDKETVIIYFSSEDEFISEEMLKLDKKFNFIRDFRIARKKLGDVIFFNRDRDYLLCGCIVRKTQKDQFNFVAFQNCLSMIQKENKKTQFYYYAFQAIKDQTDTNINYKIINLLRNGLYNSEIYVCWPGDLQNYMAERDRFSDISLNESKDSKSSFNESFPKSYSKNKWEDKNESYENRSLTQETKIEDENWDDDYNSSAVVQAESNQSETVTSTEEFGSEQNSDYWNQNLSKFGSGCYIQNYSFGSSFSQTDSFDYNSWSDDEKDWDSTLPTSQSTSEIRNVSHLNPYVPPFTPKNQNVEQIKKETTYVQKDKESAPRIVDRFELFKKDLESDKIQCNSIKEQKDFPKLPKGYSRVCFAREDLIIETGVPLGDDIALHIGKLLNQRPTVGRMLFLKENSNFCYLLIVNKVNEAPTLQRVFASIENLYDHAKKNMVKTLVVPDVDLGELSKVKYAFQYVFGNSNTDIIFCPCKTMYSEQALNQKHSNKIQHTRNAIHQMKKKSAIIYLASTDNFVTPEMQGLERKFEFLDNFKKQKKILGEVIRHKNNEDNVLYGCIVKKFHTDDINFEELQKCMLKVKEQNKEKFSLVGIQAVQTDDSTLNFKIATVLLNTLDNFTISICWPGDLREKMPQTSPKS